MSDPFVGEIRAFAGGYAPRGWLLCQGQEVNIQTYTQLFSLISTSYGSPSSPNNFKLPNLQGVAPSHQGSGPGLTPRPYAGNFGNPTVTLTSAQLPAHTHTAMGLAAPGNSTSPNGTIWSQSPKVGPAQTQTVIYAPAGSNNVTMDPNVLLSQGSGNPHNNMQPYIALGFIICYEGEYPNRP